MRKWRLTCYDCGLVFEGRLDETARDLFARWNARADLPRATAGDKPGQWCACGRQKDHENQTIECSRAPRATGETEALVDDVQRRMDLVVECAVEWHQSDEDWYEKSEALGAAIDSLLELRAATRTAKKTDVNEADRQRCRHTLDDPNH
jgi:hypothetical protein